MDASAHIFALEVPVLPSVRSVAAAMANLEKLALTVSELAGEAAKVAPNPTEKQKESGNYAKGHVAWKGLDITIETAKGQYRRGVGKDGKPWKTLMKSAYGYIRGTESDADHDHIDVFLCDEHLDSEIVFIVNQVDPGTGAFDEAKCVLGEISEDAAKAVYLRNYEPGWKGFGSIAAVTLPQFKWWIAHADTSKEVKDGAIAALENLKHKKAAVDALPTSLPYRDRVEMFALKNNQVLGGIYDKDRTFGVFGGGVDPDEDPLEAASREFFEESGHRVKNPRLVTGVRPLLQEWHPPYVTPEQEERAKKYRGSRTLFAYGDLDDASPQLATDPSHLEDIRLRQLSDAITLMHDADTNPRTAARKAVLEKLLAGDPNASKAAADASETMDQLQAAVDACTDAELNGIAVYYHAAAPKIVVIDIADYGTEDVGKRIGAAATKLVGSDHVIYHNEQPSPRGGAWVDIKKSSTR